MHPYARTLTGALALLALGALSLTMARGRDDDDKEKAMKTAAAREAVLKLVGDLGKPDDLKKEAADIAAKNDIEFVMNQFKPRDKGGLGVGPMPGTAKYDGIETELLFLGKRAMPQKDLAAQTAALQIMAQETLAVAEITPYYAPKKDEAGMPVKDWLKFSDDMKKQTKDLLDAVIKGSDPKMVQDKANTLNGSCNACHTEFRDK